MDADAIEFVLAVGRALHRYGTSAERLEEALNVCCQRLGLEAEVFTAPTALIMSFGAPTELKTRMHRFDASELDLGKLDQVDAVADAVIERRMTPTEGIARLNEIIAAPSRYSRPLTTAIHGVTAGAFAVSFGGTFEDVAVAAAIGLLLGLLAQVMKRSTDQTRVFELVGAAFAAFTSSLVSAWWDEVTPSLTTLAALIILLPGMSLTVAMTELATRHLIAGTARLMSAVIVLLQLVIGVALGERAAAAIVHIHQAVLEPLPPWAPWLALITASISVAIIMRAESRSFPWILAAAIVGYGGNLAGIALLGPQMGVMVGAFALGILGNTYARLLKRPAQVVLVPAVILLVPGSMGFRGMTSLLTRDTLGGVAGVFAMFVVAIAIVAGLLVANAVVSPKRSL